MNDLSRDSTHLIVNDQVQLFVDNLLLEQVHQIGPKRLRSGDHVCARLVPPPIGFERRTRSVQLHSPAANLQLDVGLVGGKSPLDDVARRLPVDPQDLVSLGHSGTRGGTVGADRGDDGRERS